VHQLTLLNEALLILLSITVVEKSYRSNIRLIYVDTNSRSKTPVPTMLIIPEKDDSHEI